MRLTKAQRQNMDVERDAFCARLEAVLDPNRPYFLPSNIKPPRDFQFAHGVLSGYVTGLKSETKQD